MKSLKSLFALFAIATLSVGCAATNDTPVAQTADAPQTVITITDDAAFAGGNDVKPIVTKPKL